MKGVKFIFGCILIYLFNTQFSLAQSGNLIDSEDYKSTVYLINGFDNSIVTTSVGYARVVPFNLMNKSVILSFDAGIPVLGTFDLSDYRIRIGSRINLLEKKNFMLPFELNPILRGTSNGTYKAKGFGTEIILLPGYYSQKRMYAIEISVDHQWASYIQNSSFYKTNMYPNAKDGWLSMPSTVTRLGIRSGFFIKEKIDLIIRFTYEFRGQYDHDAPPILGTFSFGWRF